MTEKLRLLIEKCENVNATILNFDVVKGTALVELKNGTPSSVEYDEKENTWN
ncbi:hypothetical protein UT300012_22340 [Paraclostridium bifermentans]